MAEQLQELKAVLQTLGLPVTGQVRLVAGDCTRIAVLTGAFASVHRSIQAEAVGALTPEQAALLTDLDRRLKNVRLQTSRPLCSELALRQSAAWRQVRGTAREALLQFGWKLEIPARDVRVGSSYPSSQTERKRQDDAI